MTDFSFQYAGLAMATRFEVFLRGDDEQHLEAVAVAVGEEIQRLDALLSRFNPSSEIARVNREAAFKPVRMDRELFALVARCEQAREVTDGYFDVTAFSDGGLVLDAERQTVSFTRPHAAIDLGGVGKGYALDCGREILLRYGVTSGVLQGGTSSALAIGDEAWAIAVRHPLQSERVVTQLALVNRGFSCSAVRHAEQTQSDVINPQTGESLTGDAACFVLAPSATDAEIYSTALLAMGREKAMQFFQSQSELGVHAVWIEGESEKLWQLSQ